MRAMTKAINYWRDLNDIPEDFMCVVHHGLDCLLNFSPCLVLVLLASNGAMLGSSQNRHNQSRSRTQWKEGF